MISRPPRLRPHQIDAASRRLRELGLVAPGATLSEDSSFGENLEATFRWLVQTQEGPALGQFIEFLERLGCSGPNAEAILLDFVLRLPDGHHMTSGERINMIAQIITDRAKLEGYNTTGVVLDGTAPPHGFVDRLLAWWQEIGAERVTRESYPEWNRHLDISMRAAGFDSIADVRALGRELYEAEQNIAFPAGKLEERPDHTD